ncbi:hypothetical protein DFH94DRAFT_810509 [Russula ochroleuca]|uniref:F-box domain-containing protein n=1 Tax=Russula ochroleuca TaxID=152965 RepID=A0A9P5MMW0_9AGAM|nr:hypothetical protein DFH94DRAFT_810509 [Russula ochroleuca]
MSHGFENEDYVLELEKNYGLTADALDQLESRKRGETALSPIPALRVMSFGIAKLPFELLHEIMRNVSEGDLHRLRRVNSIFNILTTPAVFSSITVRNYKYSARNFAALLHTPHIARHVQSVVGYPFALRAERNGTNASDVAASSIPICPQLIQLSPLGLITESITPHRNRFTFTVTFAEDYSAGQYMATYEVWSSVQFAFENLHRATGLKTLALYFDVYYHDNRSFEGHQWGILHALRRKSNLLSELRSLKIYGWLDLGISVLLYNMAPITWLTSSYRHLSFSLPWGDKDHYGHHDSESRAQVVPRLRRMLEPAVNLESLAISRGGVLKCYDIPNWQAQLATYPRLSALSLKDIIWEDGTIGEGDVVMPPPLEDFIVRHSKTLKKLELRDCSIKVKDRGREPPVCYWADVYKRLANALTELVELEVEFQIDGYEIPYLSPNTSTSLYIGSRSYYPLERLEGTRLDAEALEEFKTVIKNRGMHAGSRFRP